MHIRTLPVPACRSRILWALVGAFLTAALPLPADAADSVLKAFVAAAGPADASTAGSPGGKQYDKNILTPAALRDCLILAHRIDEVGSDLDRQIKELRNLDRLIDEQGPALKAAAKIKFRDAAAAEDLRRKVETYNAHISDRLKRTRNYNLNTEAYTGLAARFDSGCNGRAFYPSDLATVVPTLPEPVRAALR